MEFKKGYIGILIIALVLVGCSNQAPRDSTPPSPAEAESAVSKIMETEPSSSTPTEVEASENQASETQAQESKEVVLTFVDLGEPLGKVLDIASLPDALQTIKTMYPSGIITHLYITYYNTETKERRDGIVLNSNYAADTESSLAVNEIIAGYTVNIVTKDSLDIVEAYYASLDPDEYVDYNRKGNPYPIYTIDTPHALGAEFALAAHIGGGNQGRTEAQDTELKSLGYATHIFIGAEWIPKN